MKNEYLQQAEDFLKSANTTMSIDFYGLAINRLWKEKETRPLYNVTITTPRGSYSFNFWDSFYNKEHKKKPNAYDVLACMTKYNPGTFSNFCSDFGYDEDSRTAEHIYFAVQEEYSNLCRIFTAEQMEALADIQ